VLRWASEGSARCLGRRDIGAIALSRQADLAFFTLDELRFSGAGDPIAALILCGAHRADRVMVARRWLVEDGAPLASTSNGCVMSTARWHEDFSIDNTLRCWPRGPAGQFSRPGARAPAHRRYRASLPFQRCVFRFFSMDTRGRPIDNGNRQERRRRYEYIRT